VFAHYVAGLSWTQAWLVGAVFSPTDPVFAAAIVGRSDVPRRLRHLLNVESGVNDGLALPVVIVLLAVVSKRDADPLTLLEELALGVALGVAIPWVAIKLERLRFFQAAGGLRPHRRRG
jgi:NhaP-type Na+/H+ or K+/H+ antiporter